MSELTLTPWEAAIHIYALRDPETRRVRYVGKCISPGHRLGGHLSGSGRDMASPKGLWIQELASRSLRPEMCIVEKGLIGDGDAMEKKWISYFTERGEPLLNVVNNRPRVRQRAPVAEPDSELMTVPDVAKEKGLHESAVRLAITTGRLKGYKLGGRYLVSRDDAAAWVPKPRGPAKGGGK